MPKAHSFDKIRFLYYTPPIYGNHSGYIQLCSAMAATNLHVRLIDLRRPLHRLRRRLSAPLVRSRGSVTDKGYDDYPEKALLPRGRFEPRTVYHCLNFHMCPSLWLNYPGEKRVIATLHYLDPTRLPDRVEDSLTHLASGIALNRAHVPMYEKIVGPGRIKFVRHGVDTQFFRPGDSRPSTRRLMFIGRIARDYGMLADVLSRLSEQHRDLRFDLVLGTKVRRSPTGNSLGRIRGVTLYDQISDRQLLRLYQEAYLLLLPLTESGANNAIVEALAVGLPIVTTNVNGVFSYGADSIYPVVGRGDAGAMVALVERYLEDHAYRDEVGIECRKFAKRYLSWPIIAKAHIQAYQELMN